MFLFRSVESLRVMRKAGEQGREGESRGERRRAGERGGDKRDGGKRRRGRDKREFEL